MPARVLIAAEALRSELAGFEPALCSGQYCADVAEALAVTEKACAAARARAPARAVACKAHEARGFTDGAEWLARQVGQSLAGARSELATGEALEVPPMIMEAAVAGQQCPPRQ